jgi:O-antigen ligase
LWNISIKKLLDNPIFGGGFFFLGADTLIGLNTIMPYLPHNTLFTIAGACGFFGIISYLGYRICTVRVIIKNYNNEKFYFLVSLILLIMLSLVDIHMFDFFGTGMYITLLAIVCSVSHIKNNVVNTNNLC